MCLWVLSWFYLLFAPLRRQADTSTSVREELVVFMLLIEEPEHIVPFDFFLCGGAAVFECYAVPGGGLLVVTFCALAFFVHAGNLFGGYGVSAIGGVQVPVECFLHTLLHIVAILIELREPVLCVGVAKLGCLLVVADGIQSA